MESKALRSISPRPNHSFTRKHWGMPPFGPPFHSGPNAVVPHCSG